MAKSFEDIKIIDLDAEASYPSGQGALQTLVLKLSGSAPYEWADYFDQAWRNHIYMSKRSASVSGARLEITCMPDELESDHLPELKKVIAETNQAYAKYAEAQSRAAETEAEAERRRQDDLANLKGRLNFD